MDFVSPVDKLSGPKLSSPIFHCNPKAQCEERNAGTRVSLPAEALHCANFEAQKPDTNQSCLGASGNVPAVLATRHAHDVPNLIEQIIAHARRRKFAIAQQMRLNGATRAYVASLLIDSHHEDDGAREARFKRAAAIISAIENGKPCTDPVYEIAAPAVLANASGRHGFDELRIRAEKEMASLASNLPAANWASGVKGFTIKGLAIVIGETGDLANYSSPAKVWKRCGLAVMEGVRQGNPGGGATKEDWIAHGYNRQRRAEMWSLMDAMFRHQWRGEKDGTPAHAIGPYGEVYARRKAFTAERDWTPKHRDNDARRIMTKAFLKDLWAASRRSE